MSIYSESCIVLLNYRLLKETASKVQYYQWILGNMCKEHESALLFSAVSKCNNETELKSLINQPIVLEEEIGTEFGTDHALITYCEVSSEIARLTWYPKFAIIVHLY